MEQVWAFQPGTERSEALPLERFLPPLNQTAAASSLAALGLTPGSWVLDPFGSSPSAAVEMARAGWRVLVCAANPVLAFLMEVLSQPPGGHEIQTAVAALAESRRAGERLESHIRGLYRVRCASCGQMGEAEAFHWRRGEAHPYSFILDCPTCGASGDQPCTRESCPDPAFGQDALHRARALSRAANPEDPFREDVLEALEGYLPRPLYVLQTLINRLEGLGLPSGQRRVLHALLLELSDLGSALWPLSGRARPRQLVIPSSFRESNLWLALEKAAAAWAGWAHHATPLALVNEHSSWRELPEQGGIALFRGRVRELRGELPALAGGLTVLPRPNQAFWTLSALWASWLWGRENASALQAQLSRRRYDWNWHAAALHSPLRSAAGLLPRDKPLLCLIPEATAGFCAAAAAAAGGAGFGWHSEAVRADQDMAQVLLISPGKMAGPASAVSSRVWQEGEKAFSQAVVRSLSERHEPQAYLPLYCAGLGAMLRAGCLPPLDAPANDLVTRIQALAGKVFSEASLLRRYELGSQEDENCLWWLESNAPSQTDANAEASLPLADLVEMETVRLLQRSSGLTRGQIDAVICRRFPGRLTPAAELVKELLESYGHQDAGGLWTLARAEEPSARRADLDEARGLLRNMGGWLDYQVSGETPLVWTPRQFGQVYMFFVIASAVVSRHVLGGLPVPGGQVVMVFPGSRAKLLAYKLVHDPRLARTLSSLHLLKFRHLRSLGETEHLTRESFESLLDDDPPFFEEAEQLRLL